MDTNTREYRNSWSVAFPRPRTRPMRSERWSSTNFLLSLRSALTAIDDSATILKPGMTQANHCSKRLFLVCAGCIGFAISLPCISHAGTTETDLGRDFNRSAFSTTSILSDLTKNKHLSRPEVTTSSDGSAIVSSQPGAFQYDPDARQSTAAHKVTEAIRDTQKMEDQRNAEITQHPFWYAPFWTHSPLAIAGFLLGGDHHALETPPTEFEKLGAAAYGNEAEVRKFERSVSFGTVNSTCTN